MADPVKTSGRRAESARRTRRAIVDAARDLFVADGYGTTPITAIADRAGVAVQTVYAVFGTKRAILAEALDLAIAGDELPVAVNDRDWMRDVFGATSAAERLGAYAAAVRRIMEGAGDVFVVLSAAAAVDPEVAELATSAERRRRTGAASVVDAVRDVGSLRPGLSRAAAVDVLSLLNSPATFQHLVRRSGWSPARYEAWLAGAMRRELLAD